MATATSAGRTEALNGIQIYFETHGGGESLLLLHGFSGSSQDWLPSAPGGVQSSGSSLPLAPQISGSLRRRLSL